MSSIALKKFEPAGSKEDFYFLKKKAENIPKIDFSSQEYRGYFCFRGPQFFALYRNSDEQLIFAYNGNRLALNKSYAAARKRNFWGTRFKLFSPDKQIIYSVTYHTSLKYFLLPWTFILDIFCPADDWDIDFFDLIVKILGHNEENLPRCLRRGKQ